MLARASIIALYYQFGIPLLPFLPSTIICSLILYVEIKRSQSWILEWHPNAISIITPELSSFPLMLLIYVQCIVIQPADLCFLVITVNDLPALYSRYSSQQCG